MRLGLESFLCSLIRCYSPSGREEGVAQLVVEEMERLGYERVRRDKMGNVTGRISGGRGPPILFDGHMDVVDPGDYSAWRHEPFSAKTVHESIQGRGAVDMKGGLAALIYGCAQAEPSADVIVACVVHEETYEGLALLEILKGLGEYPRAVVLGEPTDLKLAIGQRGRLVLRLVTSGRTSHASMPELGENAIDRMVPVLEGIMTRAATLPVHPGLGKGTMAVTSISALPGSGPVIPDRCQITLDRRLVPGEEKGTVLREMRSFFPETEVHIASGELECYTGTKMPFEEFYPGWLLDPGHALVKAGLKALCGPLGSHPEVSVWRFSTDGVASAGALGIPTIGFGPGDPSLAHQPNESISVRDVKTAATGFKSLAELVFESERE